MKKVVYVVGKSNYVFLEGLDVAALDVEKLITYIETIMRKKEKEFNQRIKHHIEGCPDKIEWKRDVLDKDSQYVVEWHLFRDGQKGNADYVNIETMELI